MIIHKQQQITSSSCVPACIAMITGVDQQLIIDEMKKYNDSSGGTKQEFRQWVRMGYLPRQLSFSEGLHSLWGKVALATVPSLNIEGGLHRIVIDLQGENIKVYDPNEGKENKKVHTWPLRTYTELTVVEYCR